MNAIETLRSRAVSEVLKTKTMTHVWPTWQPLIQSSLNSNSITTRGIQDLGNDIYNIFYSTAPPPKQEARPQDLLSGAGVAWESFVCWYLNLCLLGSNTVIVKNKPDTPQPISDCITVMYGSNPSNTESDLTAITFPDDPELKNIYSGSKVGLKRLLNSRVTEKFSETSLTVIQCKTNWNDNAQEPMLWDIIYSAGSGRLGAASVGRGGFAPSSLKYFSYAFVTVPTVNPSKFKHTAVPVLRVRALSGGNYWGRPAKSGIAMNIFDMLDKNFQESLGGYVNGWHNDLPKLIDHQIKNNDYFKLG